MRKLVLVILAIALFAPLSAMGAELQLRLETDQSNITLNDTFNVDVVVSGKIRSVPTPRLPASSYFKVIGRSTSQNISIVNASVTAEHRTSFTLMPLKAGTAKIGPAKLTYKRKKYKSNSVAIRIINPGSVAPPSPSAQKGQTVGETREAVFLRTEVSNPSPYLGSQVTVSLYLYTRAQVNGLSFSSIPDFNDFWAEELTTPKRPNFTSVDIGGVPYEAALIRRYALFPLKSGEITLDPFAMVAQVTAQTKRKKRRGGFPFDDDVFGSFFGRSRQINMMTKPLKLNIRPLPKEGRPANFQGAVGDFKLVAQLSDNQTKAGEPVTLNVKVSGKGNLNNLHVPKITMPESISTFSESSDQNLQNAHDAVTGTKTFDVILVPQQSGEFLVGPVTLNYFDPVAEQYKQVTAAAQPLTVLEGSGQQAKQALPITQQEITLSGEDIRYIRPDVNKLREISAPYYKSPVFYIWFAVLPVLWIVVFMIVRMRRAALADTDKLKMRRAGRVSRARLKKAAALRKGEAAPFYQELTAAVLQYIADKSGQPASGIVISSLLSTLKQNGATKELLADMKGLFTKSDAVRFGGASDDPQARKEALALAGKIIDGLDKGKHFKGGR